MILDVLKLIHRNICRQFHATAWNDQQYVMTFIDDFQDMATHISSIEKLQSLDIFKIFKVRVENQLSKTIKSVRSDHGGEYYGRYDGSGEQHLGPFANFL